MDLYTAVVIDPVGECIYTSLPFSEDQLETTAVYCQENDNDYPVDGFECVIATCVEDRQDVYVVYDLQVDKIVTSTGTEDDLPDMLDAILFWSKVYPEEVENLTIATLIL